VLPTGFFFFDVFLPEVFAEVLFAADFFGDFLLVALVRVRFLAIRSLLVEGSAG
jgi:hypothetical protein